MNDIIHWVRHTSSTWGGIPSIVRLFACGYIWEEDGRIEGTMLWSSLYKPYVTCKKCKRSNAFRKYQSTHKSILPPSFLFKDQKEEFEFMPINSGKNWKPWAKK